MEKEYKSIIPFGCMCSVALHLNKLGLRSKSAFFDWLTSDIQSNMKVVDDDFTDFFNAKYFRQDYQQHPHLVTHTKYHFIYSHVFDAKRSLKRQYHYVQRNVQRSIDNFKALLNNKPSLLLYYSRDEKEITWICENQDLLAVFAKRHECDLAFVFNYPAKEGFSFPAFVIRQNDIHKPIGGGVSFPLIETGDLDAYLLCHYADEQRKQNLLYRPKTHLIHKLFSKIRSYRKDRLRV